MRKRRRPKPLDVSAIDVEGEPAQILVEESLVSLEALCEKDTRPLHAIPEEELRMLMNGISISDYTPNKLGAGTKEPLIPRVDSRQRVPAVQ